MRYLFLWTEQSVARILWMWDSSQCVNFCYAQQTVSRAHYTKARRRSAERKRSVCRKRRACYLGPWNRKTDEKTALAGKSRPMYLWATRGQMLTRYWFWLRAASVLMARYSATAYPPLPPLTLPIEDAVHSGAAGAAVHSGPALCRTPSWFSRWFSVRLTQLCFWHCLWLPFSAASSPDKKTKKNI